MVVLLVSLGTLTGRRKLLIQVVAFACAFFGLSSVFQQKSRKIAGVIGAAALVGYLAVLGVDAPDRTDRVYDSHQLTVDSDELYWAYALRARSVVEDVGDRLTEIGFRFAFYAYDQWGFFGAGLGAGSQGTQHFGSDDVINRGAAEGGFGKLMLELGVPGFVVAIWLAVATVRYFGRALGYLAAVSPHYARIGYGLTALLAANAATFTAATQAYGDVFILMSLGWLGGFLLALPVLAARTVRRTGTIASAQFVRHPAIRTAAATGRWSTSAP
jgi:hypothetical protein